MDAPSFHPYDRNLECDDCGTTDRYGRVYGFGSVITQQGESRIYCANCRHRRGAAYLFDGRPWAVIAAAQRAGAA